MISAGIKHKAGRFLTNLPGWRTSRKIVVIESDDWGSIRMPSRDVYKKCLKAGYRVDMNPYEHYDSLASKDDLELLFDLLSSFKDKNGNNPIITANCVVANPDFKKIKQNNFLQYHYEVITDTFKRYPRHSNNFKLWQEGTGRGIFFPQFHAREHLNVSLFMEALQNSDPTALWGFQNEMPGSIAKGLEGLSGNHFVEATKYKTEKDKEQKLAIYLEGLALFKKLFEYASESIIPPNYIWSPAYNEPVQKQGVRFFQGNRKMQEPIPGRKPIIHKHYLGQVNCYGQTYLIRNVLFEPSIFKLNIYDLVSRCLSDISIAFQMKKPAIISCHRINLVGFIDENNRDRTLRFLKQLMDEALKRWPDIEFLNSCQLGAMISNEQTK